MYYWQMMPTAFLEFVKGSIMLRILGMRVVSSEISLYMYLIETFHTYSKYV